MNFLKRGPEVNLSTLKNVKVPGFLQDIYYDLKDRHLLPVALILVAAIIAVPIAISDSGSEPEAAGGGASAGASGSAIDVTATGALVAKAAPGLRKYQQRLETGNATNPFKQKYEKEKAEAEGGGGEPAGSPEPTEPSYYSPPSAPGSGSDPDGDGKPGTLIHYSYAIDVRVSGGSGDKKESSTRKNLPELTMLPSRSTPALAFVGPTKDGKKAVMIVSSDVKALFGDNRCILGTETCEMLVLEPGLPETVVYGGAEKTYTVELLKVELIKTSELNKAALGKSKNGKKSDRLADTVGLSDVYQR